jgi:hypothetical protein
MNAESLILVRLLDPEKVMLVKRDAPRNAEAPILVTPLGIVMLVKLDALWNALLPILVRLLDPEKVTLVKLDALWNA